ncbi:DUF6094 domain-containing protein [Massiliimalia massiliensis]|uniref:DUF6094 domain-containing protein n=1 Tax=Massiliimalia massiliensis TaxID=1852384 RepID=UPI000986BE89|nr:DUF6094 domain-containing protein [Massiliimalia massiliensis]
MYDEKTNYFCLNEINDCVEIIQSIRKQLPEIRSEYEQSQNDFSVKTELKNTVRQLVQTVALLIQLLNEYGENSLAETAVRLLNSLKNFDYLGTQDYTQLCLALKAFETMLPCKKENVNMAALGRLANRVKLGYYPTDLEHVDRIKKAIYFPAEPVNLIDPCCGEGKALSRFAYGTNAVTYGIELDELRGMKAQQCLNRVGFGSYFHSRISYGVFQCLFLNPPYLSVPSEFGNRRLEKSFLTDSLRLLVNDGLLIYIIPYYRATYEICKVICENFSHIQVYKFVGKEFEHFHQIVFMGTKTPKREASQMAMRLSEYLISPDMLQPITQLPESGYKLPVPKRTVERFEGAVFHVAELAEQLKKSKSINYLFDNKVLDNRVRQPLLPLNLSQIGLVGASGMMNGLIQCDTPHIIKGRIVKEKKTKTQFDPGDRSMEVTEITSNKLIFNILTSKGYRSIG